MMINPDKVLPAGVPEFRSVSQVLEYTRCPYAYYLHRIKKAWQKPAAWLPQGLAVHGAAEAYERSGRTMTLLEVQKVYTELWDAEINAMCEITPDFSQWFGSGPYRGVTDVQRRYGIGKEQAAKYVDYYELHPDDVPDVMPDGQLGIEYAFTVKFGEIPVRGVIDYIGKRKPRDNKTGNKPGEPFQLATYAGVIEQLTGEPITIGDFWMGKTGRLTKPVDLTDYSQDRLANVYGETDELIRAENFVPIPEPSKCMFCTVRSSCDFAA